MAAPPAVVIVPPLVLDEASVASEMPIPPLSSNAPVLLLVEAVVEVIDKELDRLRVEAMSDVV
jgi:hypothetical protein